jgi:fibronectin type 3 domain-containing protein
MKRYGILLIGLLAILFMFCETTISPEDEIDDTDTTAPAIPTGLAIDVNASIEDTIKVTWSANTDDDFDLYRVYRSVNTDSLLLYQQVSETHLNYYIDAGVDYGTLYFYRVSAVDENDNESDKSAAISYEPVNIFTPRTPTGFSAYGYNLPGESPYVELRWTPNTESDFLHYNVYRHTSRGFTSDSAFFITQTTEAHYTDNTVDVGQRYYYRLTAVDKGLMASNPTSDESDLPLPQPSLVFPNNAATTTTLRPNLEWERVEDATKYEVIVQTSLYSGVVWTGEVTQPASGTTVNIGYPSEPALSNNTKYYWLVAVFSSDNTAANTYSDSTRYFFTLAK